jgi:UDP-N-acetylglucosamine 3-dehydrogenase
MLRVGVVGLGSMGQNHVRVYSELGCELVGVSDVSIDRAKEIACKYHTRYYTDYRKLIPEVDAVSIVVPTTLHSMVADDFINGGVSCLVEKPIASSMQEASEMVKAAKRNDVKLMVGHIERFNPAVTRLKQLLQQSRLGKLIQISTRRVGPYAPRIRDVGIIIDSATHDIDIARYLLNMEPVSIYSKFGQLRHEKEDHAVLVLDFDDVTACIEVNWFSPQKVRTLVATGSEGTAYLDYIEQELIIHNSHAPEKIEVKKAEPLKLELEHFLACVEMDSQPLVDGLQGMCVLNIALEACKHRALY